MMAREVEVEDLKGRFMQSELREAIRERRVAACLTELGLDPERLSGWGVSVGSGAGEVCIFCNGFSYSVTKLKSGSLEVELHQPHTNSHSDNAYFYNWRMVMTPEEFMAVIPGKSELEAYAAARDSKERLRTGRLRGSQSEYMVQGCADAGSE